MKFVDKTEIQIKAGDGGSGLLSFRSAKNLPKLGVDGGDGGFGGHVWLVGQSNLSTLSSLYYKRLYRAEDGQQGGANGRTGRNGEDLEIPVPPGTVARCLDSGRVVAEIIRTGQRVRVARGGKRGLGNRRYLSSRHQAPEEITTGGPGEEMRLGLELKLIADAGLAGFPNAGKSTLLSRVSAARPEIADYPFTTLTPRLGVVEAGEDADEWEASFTLADIPGLIEGAAAGKGLGHDFLRHLDRTQVIVYVLDPFPPDGPPPAEALRILQGELQAWSPQLAQKSGMIVLTKTDLAPPGFSWDAILASLEPAGLPILRLSSRAGAGLAEFRFSLYKMIKDAKNKGEITVREKPATFGGLEEYEFVSGQPT